MAKNIVIFSDGTGQEGGKRTNTNVYHLFNMIEARTDRQVAYYQPGLGTGLRKLTGNVGGMGISRNIAEAYGFIHRHYQAGDTILLIGFSRGAATVRSLSNFIHHFGILPESRPQLIRQAYRIYRRTRRDKLHERAQEFVARHNTMWARIHFVGCFDTVAALGLPFPMASAILDGLPFFRHRFHDFRLSESIENAYQALAIDDERRTFHPVLWDTEHKDYQKIRQVWFTGMHTDVGGGYREKGLSDIALVWLTQQAVAHGLRIYPGHRVQITENALDMMHNSRGRTMTRLYRRKIRSWDVSRTDLPIIHQSVLDRTTAGAEVVGGVPYAPWITANGDTADMRYEIEPWLRYEDQTWHPVRQMPVD